MRYVAILTALGFASAGLLAVAAPEGQQPRASMAERLKAADTNGDGLISKEEAKALPRLAKRFDAIDANHDGQVSADEMRAFREQHHAGQGKKRGEHWKKLDTDGDGRISMQEAQAAPRLAEHFKDIDTNGDGFLSADELKAAREKHGRGK